MGDLAEALIKYGRPLWNAIGDDNAASVAGAAQKGNQGIEVGEGPNGRALYNVNADVEEYLMKHPEMRELLEHINKINK